jgi:hypothetical protein
VQKISADFFAIDEEPPHAIGIKHRA